MADCCWFVHAEETLAEKLSQLPLFQTFCGVATEPDALARIHHELVGRNEDNELIYPVEMRAKRPFGLIWGEQPGLARIADANSIEFSGQIGLMFQINIEQLLAKDPTATTTAKQARWLKDTCGRIVIDLFDNWIGMRQVLQCAWEFSQPLRGQDVDHAIFYSQFLYGMEGS